MAKSVHDDVLDGALNIVKNNATRQVACSAEPTTYTEGNATYALADITVASGDFTAARGTIRHGFRCRHTESGTDPPRRT